jgi:hypothetical protein
VYRLSKASEHLYTGIYLYNGWVGIQGMGFCFQPGLLGFLQFFLIFLVGGPLSGVGVDCRSYLSVVVFCYYWLSDVDCRVLVVDCQVSIVGGCCWFLVVVCRLSLVRCWLLNVCVGCR